MCCLFDHKLCPACDSTERALVVAILFPGPVTNLTEISWNNDHHARRRQEDVGLQGTTAICLEERQGARRHRRRRKAQWRLAYCNATVWLAPCCATDVRVGKICGGLSFGQAIVASFLALDANHGSIGCPLVSSTVEGDLCRKAGRRVCPG